MISIIITLAIFLHKILATEDITHLKIGSKNRKIEFSNITTKLFRIKTNYNHLLIQLKEFVNIEFIQLSDKLNITTINESKYKCASNVTICQSNYCLIED